MCAPSQTVVVASAPTIAPSIKGRPGATIQWWMDNKQRPLTVCWALFFCIGIVWTCHNAVTMYRTHHALQEIRQGHWTLVEIQISSESLWEQNNNRYNVEASFCNIDWNLQKNNPSSVSFFTSLQEQSKTCASTLHSFDLYDMVQMLRSHDENHSATMRVIPPTGVIFHESRCGSTLAANLLATLPKTRVYSEHFVPIAALKACSGDETQAQRCNHDLHMQLIRDVYYVLGRTAVNHSGTNGTTTTTNDDDSLDYIFYKSNSGGLYIDKFTSAFPDTPWVYMFRESHEIMQSHWKVPEERTNDHDLHAIKCARLHGTPHQPPTTRAVLERANKQHDELTKTEYCAAHLASISLSVMQEHDRTGHGRFVDYRQMPHALWDTMLPQVFDIDVAPSTIETMRHFATKYSKGHQKGRANEQWSCDTAKKQDSITDGVARAVELLAPDTYAQLAALAHKQEQQQIPQVSPWRPLEVPTARGSVSKV